MLALLQHLNRPKAVWIGHDWGAPLVWGFAAHYPEHCVAVSCLCVPYRTIEFGIDYLASISDRSIYPKDEFEFAQWDYMKWHNEAPELMRKQLEADPEGSMKVLFMPGSPASVGNPARTAKTRATGGWFKDGIPDIPVDYTILKAHPEIFEALVKTVRENGTHGPNDYYRNFPANTEYVGRSKNDGILSLPVLFIGARFDFILDTATNQKLVAPMREYCTDLTEVHIDSGHWVALEKPEETNAALAKWLAASVKDYWPGEPFVRTTKSKPYSNL
jgi:soluble epoxide hydrolase/lipid-phosphate phosphatase